MLIDNLAGGYRRLLCVKCKNFLEQAFISRRFPAFSVSLLSCCCFPDFSSTESASANQVIQKKDMKMEACGRITDIRIESFDLSYGSK